MWGVEKQYICEIWRQLLCHVTLGQLHKTTLPFQTLPIFCNPATPPTEHPDSPVQPKNPSKWCSNQSPQQLYISSDVSQSTNKRAWLQKVGYNRTRPCWLIEARKRDLRRYLDKVRNSAILDLKPHLEIYFVRSTFFLSSHPRQSELPRMAGSRQSWLSWDTIFMEVVR